MKRLMSACVIAFGYLINGKNFSMPNKARSRRLTRKRLLLTSVFSLSLGCFAIGGLSLNASPPPAMAQSGLFGSQPQSFADVVDKVQPSVVSVRVKSEQVQTATDMGDLSFFFRDLPPNHPLRKFFDDNMGPRGGGNSGPQRRNSPRSPQGKFGMAQGSGFFISEDGYVVTNNHVVENAKSVELATNDGKTLTARVIGTDPRTDLALLKVDGKDKYPYVKFAAASPRVGDWVVAIGNPFGLGGSVTAGIVSARGRDIGAGPYDDFLQIDAAVNRGNSGGPTFNLNGEVVGINTAIYSPSGGNVGIAFAVPFNVATSIVEELRDRGSITRGWLGIQIQPITAEIAESMGLTEAVGALIVEPQKDGPGEKAGLRAGDAVLQVNGEKVADARDLSRKIANIKPNAKTTLTIWRDGKEITLNAELGTLPRDLSANADQESGHENSESTPGSTVLSDLGIELQAARNVTGAGRDGVVVTAITANTPTSEKLSTGDIILAIGGEMVNTPSDVEKAVSEAQKNKQKSILIRVKSGQVTRFVAIPVAKG
jgi:serine protease Do